MGLLSKEPDRRTAPRRTPEEVPGLTGVTVCAEQVALIDVSRGGMLVEAPVRLNPGTDNSVEIVWVGVPLKLRGRVIRCQIRKLSAKGPRYEIAFAFNKSLDMLDQKKAPDAPPAIAYQGFEILDVALGDPDPELAANSW
jgi:hypothetical protein